jgi:hypothetical protein
VISIIVSPRQEPPGKIHKAQFADAIGVKYEYINAVIPPGTDSIAGAFNSAIENALGDIFVFAAEDVYVITRDWGVLLEEKFSQDPALTVLGIAGSKTILETNPHWTAAGRPSVVGQIVFEDKSKDRRLINVFEKIRKDTEVTAVSGIFFAVRASAFKSITFDEQTFDGAFFFDTDFCMQARKIGKIMVTPNILIKYSHSGKIDEQWRRYANKFVHKYRHELPVQCCDIQETSNTSQKYGIYEFDAFLNLKALSWVKNLGRETSTASSEELACRSRAVVAVTGMHRSGTSFITGILEKCGYSIGTSHEMLNKNKSHPDNLKGHFENLGVYTINEAILRQAGGTWERPPSPASIEATADAAREHIEYFFRIFNGSVIKDPRLCLTMGLWKKFSLNLDTVIHCFRHPLSVANSLHNRDGMPIEKGLILWYEYNKRLLNEKGAGKYYLIDFDKVTENPIGEVQNLLLALGSSLTGEEIAGKVKGFFSEELNHNRISEIGEISLPNPVAELYADLRSFAVNYSL